MCEKVLVTKGECRGRDLATIVLSKAISASNQSVLILPNEDYRRLTILDPYVEGQPKIYKLGHSSVKIKSEWQHRFETVLNKLSN